MSEPEHASWSSQSGLPFRVESAPDGAGFDIALAVSAGDSLVHVLFAVVGSCIILSSVSQYFTTGEFHDNTVRAWGGHGELALACLGLFGLLITVMTLDWLFVRRLWFVSPGRVARRTSIPLLRYSHLKESG